MRRIKLKDEKKKNTELRSLREMELYCCFCLETLALNQRRTERIARTSHTYVSLDYCVCFDGARVYSSFSLFGDPIWYGYDCVGVWEALQTLWQPNKRSLPVECTHESVFVFVFVFQTTEMIKPSHYRRPHSSSKQFEAWKRAYTQTRIFQCPPLLSECCSSRSTPSQLNGIDCVCVLYYLSFEFIVVAATAAVAIYWHR